MSYTLDIFYRKLKPVNSFADFLFFVSFFPQLVAGPILRASWFIPQINKQLSLNKEQVAKALLLIFTGLVKKVSLPIISALTSLTAFSTTCPLFRTGGTFWPSMAIPAGLLRFQRIFGYRHRPGHMMGFELQPNFNSPYRLIHWAIFGAAGIYLSAPGCAITSISPLEAAAKESANLCKPHDHHGAGRSLARRYGISCFGARSTELASASRQIRAQHLLAPLQRQKRPAAPNPASAQDPGHSLPFQLHHLHPDFLPQPHCVTTPSP